MMNSKTQKWNIGADLTVKQFVRDLRLAIERPNRVADINQSEQEK